MLINTGTQVRFINETTVGAGTTSLDGSLKGDSLLASLYVDSISSGTLTVSVFTLTDSGKEALLFSFPIVAAPTASLLLKASGISLQRFRVQADYTGICTYEVYVRSIDGVGTQDINVLGQPIQVTVASGNIDVRILPPSVWQTSQVTVGTSAVTIIPAALTDRKGLLVKNWSSTTDCYIAESLPAASTATAYPLSARDAIAIDLTAGTAVYGITVSGTADIRIVQAGS
jgi:hypothetical protein